MTTTQKMTMNNYIITLNLKVPGTDEKDALDTIKRIIESGVTVTEEGKFLQFKLKNLETAEIIKV